MIDAESDLEAGDAACWLGLVCPDCGALNAAGIPCWRCGREAAS